MLDVLGCCSPSACCCYRELESSTPRPLAKVLAVSDLEVAREP
jgi:hypothetical protein